MSNYLAIPTVTAALQRVLQEAIQIDIDGTRVTMARPANAGSATPERGVNLYLYQTTPNPIWQKNADARSRSQTSRDSKQNRTAWDLNYLISFYGNDMDLEPQRIMGSVIRALNDRAILDKDSILETIADETFPYLVSSDLDQQVEQIIFTPLNLSLEDLSKIWSVFFQTPYALSLAYKASVVILEGEQVSKKALPVRSRGLAAVPFGYSPIVDRVISQVGPGEPILKDSTLLIQGRNLKAPTTLVRIGELELTPQEVTENQIILPLRSVPDDALMPGVQSLQVIHRITQRLSVIPVYGAAATEGEQAATNLYHSPGDKSYQSLESNAAPFVLRPTVLKATVSNLQGREEPTRSAQIKVRVNLTVGKKQRVVLVLNEKTIENPNGYLFDAPVRRTNQNTIAIPVENVKPGEYLVRLQIDGAESLLKVDTDPNSKTFQWYKEPKIVVR